MSTSIAVIDQPTSLVASDVSDDVTLIAMNPNELQIEQTKLSKWFEQKAAIVRGDAEELETTLIAAMESGFKLAPKIEKQQKLAVKRAEFYDKCKAAVDAGYHLVPNFPVQAFAIRTTKKTPVAQESKWSNDTRAQDSNAPPLGEGRYVDSKPVSGWSHTEMEKTYDGKEKEVNVYRAIEFADEIEFPISVAKPEIMSATAAAMAQKCFDEIGVLPNRHVVKRDPIVVGIIRDPRSKDRVVTFLIGWTVDWSDL